jgi:RHS repeat-associated protein
VATGIQLSGDTYDMLDGFGRPQRVTHLDGTTEYTYYSCCGIDHTVDRDGVTTSYSYDSMNRLTATTRLGVTTTNILDAAGHVLSTIRISTSGQPITLSQSAYDLAGELIAQTNALNGATTYTRANDPNTGGLIRTTTYPDLGVATQVYYADGTLKTNFGTAVHGARYVYGTGTDVNGNQCTYSEEIKLKADGSDSSEVTTNYTDMAGRTTEVLYADGNYSQLFYNNQGQLSKQVDPDGVVTLYSNNLRGELEYTATDLNQNDQIDFGGPDRITQTVRTVQPASGTKPTVVRTDTYSWLDGQSGGTLMSRSETATTGLQCWQMVYLDGTLQNFALTYTVSTTGPTRTTTVTKPDGTSEVMTYTNGLLMSDAKCDSSGTNVTAVSYGYDGYLRRNTATDARDGTTTYAYNAADLVIGITTWNPSTGAYQSTYTSYDTMLRPYCVTQPDNTSVTSAYLLTGDLGSQSGSRTYPVAYSYDYAGRMRTMTNWTNFSTSSGARVTTWNYDQCRGWLTNKDYPDPITGNPPATPGTNGPVYSYTPGGRLSSRTWHRLGNGGNPIVTSYTYGFNDGVSGDEDGDLVAIGYSNDPLNTPSVTYGYDRLGRQNQATVAGASTTTSFYDLAGELLGESFSDGTQAGLRTTNTYVQLHRTGLTLFGASGSPLAADTFGYDKAGRLQAVSDGNNNVADYSYLANSSLVGQIAFTNSGAPRMTTTKQYDLLNRLTQISSAPTASSVMPLSFSYSYNTANQRTQDSLADGSYWTYQYDFLGQVTNGVKHWRDGTVAAGQQFGYSFDTIGNRTQTLSGGDTNGQNLRVANYNANGLNQYTSRDVPPYVDIKGVSIATNVVTVNGHTASRKWEYFRAELPVNNSTNALWTNVTVSATGQASESGNLYVAQTPEQFSYDLDGNLTNDGRWIYTWDAENRLVTMTVNTNVGPQYQLTFGYDCKGRRSRKQVWNNTTGTGSPALDITYVYDGWNLIAELTTGSGPLRTYLWGLDLAGTPQGAGGVGGLIGMTYYGGTPATNCFAAFDGNGNVAALVNAADGTVAANYEYGPFGELIRATGPMAKANPFRFSTKYQDDETDLLYYGYRYYNASTGRWLSRDPLGARAGANLYAFVKNSPVSSVDRFGLATYSIVDLDPTGWWGVTLTDVDVPGMGLTWKGFQSRYLPSDGRNGHPACPCKRENIFLAQAVVDAVGRPSQYDVYGFKPGELPAHKPDDPIPSYWRTTSPTYPLAIIDAPNTSGATGTWSFEDCAVCRTRADDGSVLDQVLGCVKFTFHRIDDHTAELLVEGSKATFANARSPGKLWKDALSNWIGSGK